MMRGTDGGIGRLTCGNGVAGAPFVSLPLKPLEPLPLLMNTLIEVSLKLQSYSPCAAVQDRAQVSAVSSDTPSRARRDNQALGR
jgi:hypothetical protein